MLPSYRVILLPRAFEDLDGILNYIARQSPQNARTTIERLQTSMQSLDRLPARYEVHEKRRDPSKTVRSMAVPPFIVYYRIDETRHVVRILSVRRWLRERLLEPLFVGRAEYVE